MSTMSSLVRWSVRDLASCFSACRFPLDDHEQTSSPHVAVKNMAFDKKNKKSFNGICNNNLSRPSKKCNNKRQLNNPIIKDKDVGVPSGNRIDHSSWSLSVDEDYIVFCFGEEGAPVKDDKGVKSETLTKGLQVLHQNSRPVNRKLRYGEDEEQVSDLNIHEIRSNANQHHIDQHDKDCVAPDKEVQCHKPCISLQEEEKEMVHKGHGILSTESRDSEQSEGSRGSFAFPVLVWDWIGSPVRMPKSEDFHLRKHKAQDVRFQCCRF